MNSMEQAYDSLRKKQTLEDFGQVFSDEQIQDYREIFNKYKSADDQLSLKKLVQALQELEIEYTKQEISRLKHKLELDDSASISFVQFTNIIARKTLENQVQDQIRELYRQFDTENCGYITASQLKNVLVGLQPQITDEQVDSIMMEADTDGDGVLTYQQFVYLCLPR